MRTILQLPLSALLGGLLTVGGALAQSQPAPAEERRELIYCADRMSHEERNTYRARMQAARTIEEKEALRAAHRTEMRARAASRGATYCDPPGQQWRGKP